MAYAALRAEIALIVANPVTYLAALTTGSLEALATLALEAADDADALDALVSTRTTERDAAVAATATVTGERDAARVERARLEQQEKDRPRFRRVVRR